MESTRQEIETALNGIIRGVLPRADFRAELKLTPREIQGWDSLNQLRILAQLEKRYTIKFAAADLPDLRTVGDLIELVVRKTQSRSGPGPSK